MSFLNDPFGVRNPSPFNFGSGFSNALLSGSTSGGSPQSNEKYLVDGAELKCVCSEDENVTTKIYGTSGILTGSSKSIFSDECKLGTNLKEPYFKKCKIKKEKCKIRKAKGDAYCKSCKESECKCKPDIDGEWINTKKENDAGGKAAVLKNCCLICKEGSLILPEESGQEDVLKLLPLLSDKQRELLGNNPLFIGWMCGDPVNLATGNFVLQKTDIVIPGSYLLNFKRSYNALDDRIGILGQGWVHNHSVSLNVNDKEVTITLEDGRTEKFKYQSSAYSNMGNTYSSLKTIRNVFEFKTRENTIYRFNQAGECIEIEDVDGNKTTYEHKNGGVFQRGLTNYDEKI